MTLRRMGKQRYSSTGWKSALYEDERAASLSGRFTHAKEPRYQMNRRLGVPQSRSGPFGEEKKLLPPTGIRTVDHPSRNLITTWLRQPCIRTGKN
jgi:hypothetical protein